MGMGIRIRIPNQLATVFNIGIGVGNTGLNRSTSRIVQIAIGRAAGQAVLYIDQRAIIVNFGNAFATSGGNIAIGTFDAGGLTDEEIAIVQAVMSFLSPLLGGTQLAGTGAQAGTGSAGIVTGTAAAIGNDSTTAVAQTAIGTVDGDATAGASQRVAVANFGLALANSGFNLAVGSVGGLPATASAQLAQADTDLARFFGLLTDTSWLQSANPFAAFSRTIDLGGLVISLGGDISGFEFLAGWDAAFALGNDATVVICQEFHDELACAPTPPPEQPAEPGPTPPAQPGATVEAAPAAVGPATVPAARLPAPADPVAGPAPVRAGVLPMTGSGDPTPGWAATALGMIGLGSVLARRRREVG